MPGRFDHFKYRPVPRVELRASFRQAPGERRREPTHRRPRGALRKIDAELSVDLVDRHPSADEDAPIGFMLDPFDGSFVLGEDFADQLFEEVFQRDNAGDTPLLVDDEGKVISR